MLLLQRGGDRQAHLIFLVLPELLVALLQLRCQLVLSCPAALLAV